MRKDFGIKMNFILEKSEICARLMRSSNGVAVTMCPYVCFKCLMQGD